MADSDQSGITGWRHLVLFMFFFGEFSGNEGSAQAASRRAHLKYSCRDYFAWFSALKSHFFTEKWEKQRRNAENRAFDEHLLEK